MNEMTDIEYDEYCAGWMAFTNDEALPDNASETCKRGYENAQLAFLEASQESSNL